MQTGQSDKVGEITPKRDIELIHKEMVNVMQLVGSPSYNQNFKPFIKSLFFSRLPFFKKNELLMRGIQIGMLHRLADMQDGLRDFNQQLSKATNDAEKAPLEKSILAQRQWIRVLQTIADGIAWRNFEFDRPILRHLSDGPGPGHITQQDYDYRAALEKFLRSLPGFPIVNDLTRTLRVGDFTVLYRDGKKIIFEIKKRGEIIYDIAQIFYEIDRSKEIPKPQKWSHLNAQMSIIERKVRLTKKEGNSIKNFFEVKIIDLDFPIKHHFRTLRRLIRKADRNGIAYETVEDGYYICVVVVDKITGKSGKVVENFKTSYPQWAKNNDAVIPFDSFNSFYEENGQFTRNILPYSVMPLSAKNCVRLMMGHLRVTILVDTSILEKKLTNAGWTVKKCDIQNRRIKDGNLKELIESEKFFEIEKDDERGTFKSSVSITDIIIAISSFYSLDFVIDSVESSYQVAKITGETGFITKNYLGERKILI